MVRIASAILLFVALLAFTAFAWMQQQAGARFVSDPAWSLIAAGDAKAPPVLVARTRALLAEQPLDQPRFNLLFAAEAKGEMDAGRRAAFAEALGALGWRDTASQQNLIMEAARVNDSQAMILHIDALLRRGRMVDNILPVLVQVEAVPEAAALLADRLALQPNWRTRYLRESGLLASPQALTARARLLERMLEKGDRLTNSELKPSLDAMMRAGLREDAARIAMRANPVGGDKATIHDPDFSQYLSLSQEDREYPLPFEWTTANRPGISAQIAPRGGGRGQLQLRWSGVGAPVMARTMVLLGQVPPSRLDVRVDSLDALDGLKMFGFGLACPGQGTVRFFEDGHDREDRIISYRTDRAAPCAYPELVVLGLPRSRDAVAETRIDSIRLLTQ